MSDIEGRIQLVSATPLNAMLAEAVRNTG